MNLIRRSLFIAFATIVPPAAFAQSSVVGTVLDPTGAAIPDAHVVAVQAATANVRETHSDDSGRFQISNLAIGIYTLRCEKPGFRKIGRAHV